MKDSCHTLIYSAVLGAVCALLMAGAGEFTAPYRQANAKAEEVRNILGVLEIPFERKAPSAALVKTFEERVRVEKLGSLTLYSSVGPEAGAAAGGATAVPFAGQGLWGPIKGFLALESDLKTIRGVTFHEQEETPGLGGEIAAPRFRNQFRGKSITGPDGRAGISIRLAGGGAAACNRVDAISGATMTCGRVETMLNAVITQVVKEGGANGE